MKPELIGVASVFLMFIILEIIFTNFFKKKGQTKSDGIVEFFTSTVLIFITQPLVLAMAFALSALVMPQYQNVLSSWHWVAVLGLFIVFDDMVQYWWHRLSHSVPWLYKLHRPHHNAPYMSIRIVYRNNFFYYLFMPNIWLTGILIFLGGGWVYAGYLIVKMTIIYGAHSDVRWDKPLYNIKWLSPVMWVVERTISTPATHHAHHGKHATDGITNYKGNFGNMLFFWDILFGTAKITRQYPPEMGVEDLPETSIGEQLIWPLISKSKSK